VDNPLAILSTRSDPCRVDRAAEKLALAEAKARLTERFPTLDGEVVEATIRVAHAEMTGPIRTLSLSSSNASPGSVSPAGH
jgi:hypothetical protein